MGDQRPIGIFDSGVGGLTVLKEIRERLPLEPTIYVADLLHFPYGPRYQDEVRGFALDIIRRPVIRKSRATTVVAAHAGTAFRGTNEINAAATMILSTSGSINLPKFVTTP